jgi:arginase
MAARRLGVLSQHLQVNLEEKLSARLCVQPTAESSTSNTAGTFTVIDNNTGKSYVIASPGDTPLEDVVRLAQPYTKNRVSHRGVQFIGAPFAQGQNLSGSELTPMAMRQAGMKGMVEQLGWEFLDDGDLCVDQDLDSQKQLEWRSQKYCEWVRSGTSLTYSEWAKDTIRTEDSVHVHKHASEDPYATVKNAELIGKGCGLVYQKVLDASSHGNFALTIGGDHSIASGTIGALVKTYPELAVVWVDAHADANTPDTSPSNHYHGMPAAHLFGWFKKQLPGFEWLQSALAESRLAYIGLRDIDPEEGQMLQDSGVMFTPWHMWIGLVSHELWAWL